MERPSVLAFVLCEQFIVEEKTRNVTLVNCFSQRIVERSPPEPLSFMVVAQLVGGNGEMSMGVVIERLDTMGKVFEQHGRVRFSDPLHEMRFALRVVNCTLPIIGHYQVSLFAEGEILALRRLVLKHKEKNP